jgi:hypothetical protein
MPLILLMKSNLRSTLHHELVVVRQYTIQGLGVVGRKTQGLEMLTLASRHGDPLTRSLPYLKL